MPANRAIRIIKRQQRELLATRLEVAQCDSKTDSQIRRDIFRTITLWIEDQRERKQELSQRRRLFSEPSTDMAAG